MIRNLIHISFNPNASNIQYNESNGKNYLIAEEPGYGYCFAEEMENWKNYFRKIERKVHSETIK